MLFVISAGIVVFQMCRDLDKKVWLIPAEAVKNYRRGLQGFASVKERKQREEAILIVEIKQAVSAVQSDEQDERQETGQDVAGTSYVSVEQAAKRLNMSRRRVRYLCSKGRIAGAQSSSGDWLIPSDTLNSICRYVKV